MQCLFAHEIPFLIRLKRQFFTEPATKGGGRRREEGDFSRGSSVRSGTSCRSQAQPARFPSRRTWQAQPEVNSKSPGETQTCAAAAAPAARRRGTAQPRCQPRCQPCCYPCCQPCPGAARASPTAGTDSSAAPGILPARMRCCRIWRASPWRAPGSWKAVKQARSPWEHRTRSWLYKRTLERNLVWTKSLSGEGLLFLLLSCRN